jgi:hypothetical protein
MTKIRQINPENDCGELAQVLQVVWPEPGFHHMVSNIGVRGASAP